MQDYLNQNFDMEDFKFEMEELVYHRTNGNQLLIIVHRYVNSDDINLYTCRWLSSMGEHLEDVFKEYELTKS